MRERGEPQRLTRRDALKLGGAAGAFALVPGLLAACGGGGATGGGSTENVTLTFWDTNAGPDRTPVWQHLINQFEASQRHVKVQYVGVPEAQYVEKLQTAIAGGQVPDVANPGLADISPFIAQNGLLPLDKYFDAWSGRSDFSSDVVASVRSVAPDQKLYMIPYSADVNVLYYRKDLLQKAGLPTPTTWNDFYKDAAALTQPSQGMYGFGLRGGSGSAVTLESWLYAASGITTYFDKQGKATLDQPAMVTALERWAAMYGKDTSKSDLGNEYRAMTAEFDAGHAAMIFHNLGSYPGHVKALGAANVGVIVLPPAPTGKTTLEGESFLGNMILRGSKYPQQAWTFIQFLSSAASQSYFNQQIGQIPADIKAANEPWVKTNVAVQAAKAALDGKDTVIVSPPWYLPAYTTAQLQMEPNVQKVLLGQLSAKSFLQQWASLMTTAEAQYKKAHSHR